MSKADKILGGILLGTVIVLVAAACAATAMEGTDASLKKAREILEAGANGLRQAEKERAKGARKAEKPSKERKA